MKILHCGDIHLDPSTSENVARAMAQILEIARTEKPDLIVNGGDIAMKRGTLSPWVAEALREWHCQLAEIAPVVVVAGNHDMTFSWEEAGTLRGALAFSREDGRIYLAERPCVFVPETKAGPIAVACLPYPSKHSLQAANGHVPASEINERLSTGLAEVARGLAIEAEQVSKVGTPPILVYHGSIRGAQTGTELTMGTEIDPVLELAAIPEVFGAVLCSHVHKPQMLGRAVYSGSPCPLNFGEENHEHGVMLWTVNEDPKADVPESAPVLIGESASRVSGAEGMRPALQGAGEVRPPHQAGTWHPRFIELEPKHRLLTLDLRGETDPIAAFQARSMGRIEGARMRILLRLPRGVMIEPVAARLEWLAKEAGAFDCRLQVERDTEDRSAAHGDVRAEAALDALLEVYAQRNPEVSGQLDALKALGAEIDGELPPEARALERIADYRLVAIRWSNWKSFAEEAGEILVGDLGRLVCIEGENASGKSNLTEVESFALWGRLPRGKVPLGQLVRIGAREAWCEVDVIADDTLWRVRRAISVSSKGDGKGLLTLQRLSSKLSSDQPVWPVDGDSVTLDGFWCPANAGDARETQALIEQLVGPFELYLATRFASQGDIDRLISMTGAELKDTIQGALGTGIFEHRERAAKSVAAQHERAATEARGKAEALEEQAGALDHWRALVTEYETEAQDAAVAKLEAKRMQQAASDNLEKARGDLAVATEARKARQGLDQRSGQIRERIRLLAEQRAKLEQLVAGAEPTRKALEEHRARVEQLEALAADEANYLQRANACLALRDQVAEFAARRKSDGEAWHQRHQAAVREKAQAVAALERDQKTAAMIDVAPFGEKCAEAKCRLLRLPIEARDRLPRLQELASAAADRQETLEREQAQATETAKNALIDLQAKLRRAETDLDGSREAGERAANLRREIQRFNQAEANAKIDAASRAQGQLEAIDQLQLELEVQQGDLVAEMARMEADGLAEAERRFSDCQSILHACTNLIQATTERETAAREKLATVSTRLATAQEAAEKARAARELADAALNAQALAGIFARAMGRDGVPYLMLERALPALEEHANGFLAYDNLSIEVEPARDLRTGEQRTEVYVRYRDGFGLHELAAASGFQRVALGYALRAALAQVQAEAHGLRVSHWVGDEGWSAASENNLLGCQQMLMRLAEKFQRVFFVSHQSEIRQVADSRILVIPDVKNGSRVEVAA